MIVASVRGATVADAPAIARIHWESWVATYTGIFPPQTFAEYTLAQRETLWTREAALNAEPARRSQLLVAEQGGRIAGFAHVGPYRVRAADTPDAAVDGELRAIYLDPALQRQGIGRLLWAAALLHLRGAGFAALRLWVIAGNPAEAYYRAMGAQQVGSATFDAHGVALREHCYRAELR